MLAWHDRETIVTFANRRARVPGAKAPTPGEHEQIRLAPTPLAAKRAGRTVALPADWERRRTRVMLAVIRAKFSVPAQHALLLGPQ